LLPIFQVIFLLQKTFDVFLTISNYSYQKHRRLLQINPNLLFVPSSKPELEVQDLEIVCCTMEKNKKLRGGDNVRGLIQCQ